jgi:Trk K+ transport system NAD-binding subunit
VKFLPAQFAYLLEGRETRRNLRALASFGILMAASITVFTVLFHGIMLAEGQDHSWLTGLYWTLTVMSTLGFGDITFHSDLGRAFTLVVLLYGIVMLLIVAPFTFIRSFYAPWLEAQLRSRAPREVDEEVSGHVVICHYDQLARDLIDRLAELDVPYVVIEPDSAEAAHLHAEGISVMTGSRNDPSTFHAVGAERARMIFANLTDVENTNITLTVREISPDVAVAALAENVDSVDVIELSGATHVLPMKQKLGEQLATRVPDGTRSAQRIGSFGELVIAEFPIHGTALPGRTVKESKLRQMTGLNIVAVWEKGRLMPAGPNTLLSDHSVPVVVGTEDQITALDALFVIYQTGDAPVLVIGGGNVGRAVSEALRSRGASVTILEQNPELESKLETAADRVVIGDASNLDTVKLAGIDDVRSVVLTTHDDATNAFLAIYCRKLSHKAHIISRVCDQWNLEAIHRAGADFTLSHASVAVQTLVAIVRGLELIVIGEGAELFVEITPQHLCGQTLASSDIGSRTGLNVVAIKEDGVLKANPPPDAHLVVGSELVMLGTAEQRLSFLKLAKIDPVRSGRKGSDPS